MSLSLYTTKSVDNIKYFGRDAMRAPAAYHRHMDPETAALLADLPPDDRRDVVAAAHAAALAAGAPDADAAAARLLALAAGDYVAGRVNGLCHEGALELFRDAVARAAPAIAHGAAAPRVSDARVAAP